MYQEVQKGLQSIGYGPKLESVNHRFLSILAATSLGIISQWIFLIHEAASAEEYMESIYVITACTSIVLSFANTILIKKKLHSFIKANEEYFMGSK